jgi:hypothetical protein
MAETFALLNSEDRNWVLKAILLLDRNWCLLLGGNGKSVVWVVSTHTV